MTALVHHGAATHLIEWLFGDDTGISSKSMAAIALGVTRAGRREFGAPHDPSDFGRCYRLVLAVPEIIDAFPAISKRVPVFAGILENWDELCSLYERDLPTGRSNDLYNCIKELRGETRRIGGAA